ncbi:MAG: hypothetical protein Q7U04_06525 [Bacteriovorax sp.]|nr:hypothetical protein [Bacteriovorax sp.]
MSTNPNTITKGRILVYRVYDIGEEVDLEKAGKILADATTSRSKFRLKKINRQAVIVSNDPLSIIIGNYTYKDQGQEFSCEMSAKLWDFGTLSITFEYNIPAGTSIDGLRELSKLIQHYEDLENYARAKALELSHQIQEAIGKINEIKDTEVNEDFILYFIEKFANDYADASQILDQEDIAALILTEEKYTLSPQIYVRLYESKLQYYKNDLAVIDWNSAFIIEPSGSLDIPDVIEFALSQLLEMRYYDDLLDKKLREIYSAIELKEMNIFSSRYTDLALEAGQRYIEIAEIVETVENSLKVIGDLYHSVVFRMASSKFRFNDWQSSIDNKLENLADICKLLLDNINHRRSHILELIVVALISLELIPLFEHIQKLFK